MTTQSQPIVFQEDVMIPVYLSNGCFEVNQELLPTVKAVVDSLGLSSLDDLKTVTEEKFFEIFTPLLNAFYGLI